MRGLLCPLILGLHTRTQTPLHGGAARMAEGEDLLAFVRM